MYLHQHQHTGNIDLAALLGSLLSALDQPLQAFVVDVGRGPLRDLVASELLPEFHIGLQLFVMVIGC